jgi:DNA-binding response OmpR family regulator
MPRILVIETEPSLRHIIGRTLAGEGHEVLEAQSGAEGLRLWQARGADLVLTDVLLPETSGVEVILELRGFLPTLPIVAMPGAEPSWELDLLNEAHLLGAVRLLPKPFLLGELLGAVAAALPPESGSRARSA